MLDKSHTSMLSVDQVRREIEMETNMKLSELQQDIILKQEAQQKTFEQALIQL